jgi:DNA-directed RNA polymerase subunit M/transcription elongation factor TFIIS
MWNMKKCPRCRGDVYIDEDLGACYEKCLQCGYERELERVAVSRANKGTEKEKTRIL